MIRSEHTANLLLAQAPAPQAWLKASTCKRTPAQAAQLVQLREVVAHQVSDRHRLVCSRSIARKAVQALRQALGVSL